MVVASPGLQDGLRAFDPAQHLTLLSRLRPATPAASVLGGRGDTGSGTGTACVVPRASACCQAVAPWLVIAKGGCICCCFKRWTLRWPTAWMPQKLRNDPWPAWQPTAPATGSSPALPIGMPWCPSLKAENMTKHVDQLRSLSLLKLQRRVRRAISWPEGQVDGLKSHYAEAETVSSWAWFSAECLAA